ncbi:hypothetical protein KP509_02G105800 [Ceratopteris richardii]|nr:hypothetical protein KP509_02G105800 [Ceratopteris richardii]
MNAVRWAASSCLRREDTVILLHVQHTDGLYGADWGDLSKRADLEDVQQRNGLGISSMLASSRLVQPLLNAKIPYKIHVVRDYDRKERICLEAERLRLNALIIGMNSIDATRSLGSGAVSEYCATHCECPVIIVRFEGVVDDAFKMQDQLTTLYLDSKI